MPNRSAGQQHSRQAPRLKLPAMYTFIRVRPEGHDGPYRWTGYIYDISSTGMRFELDEPLEPGTAVEVRAMLPGSLTTTICAIGRVVRLHDDDPYAAPVRMGLAFESFSSSDDHAQLETYLETNQRMAA